MNSISYFALEIQNFEPIEQEIGVGFHLDKPDSSIYTLPPRGTAIIPLSVISSMWGSYSDLLQLEVKFFDYILFYS
jgi:hypothetical protein